MALMIKELVSFIKSPAFQNLHAGDHYIIPKRLNQDVVEYFFSIQRQALACTP